MTPDDYEEAATAAVRALDALDLEGLRAAWRQRLWRSAEASLADFLRNLLAWKIQADQLGGLDPVLKRALARGGQAPDPRKGLGQGARISREWRGRRHDVDLTEGGFVYEGVTYKSLSEVARKITGVRWNGPRFFGLRDHKAAA